MGRCVDALLGDYLDLVLFLLLLCVETLAFCIPLIFVIPTAVIEDREVRNKVGIGTMIFLGIMTLVYFGMTPVDYVSHLGWRAEHGINTPGATDDYQGNSRMSDMPVLIFPNIHITAALDNKLWTERLDEAADLERARIEGDLIGGLCKVAGFLTSLPATIIKIILHMLYSWSIQIYWIFNPWLIGLLGVALAMWYIKPGRHRYSSYDD